MSVKTYTEEISRVISGNTIYNDNYPQWRYLLESYLGGDDYRQAGHLTRYQLETDVEYQARLRNTPLDNHCASVISVYNSFLFREHPDRDFSNNTESFELEMFLRDADHDGRSLDAFMKDVATWSSVFGHSWIVIAKPNIGAQTLAEEQAQGIRPYVNLLTPMVVLDWRYQRKANGAYRLVYLKYIEDVNGNVQTVKEWREDLITTTEVDLEKGLINNIIEEVNGLGRVPAVCAYSQRSLVRGIGVSDINDIADWQRALYNFASEADQSVRLDSHPSLVKTPETEAGVGAGAIIHMPDNLDPGLKPYVLDFAGASVDKILALMKHGIDAIDKMANTGAVRATESRTLSGVAMETEFSLLNARLSEKADNLELAEEQMWDIWFAYQGEQWMGEVDYPGSFNIRDTSKEIEQLQIAANTQPADPRVKAAIDMKILDWLDLDEDELTALRDSRIVNPDSVPEEDDKYVFAPHIMVDPITGEERLTQSQEEHIVLANQGWYHKKD